MVTNKTDRAEEEGADDLDTSVIYLQETKIGTVPMRTENIFALQMLVDRDLLFGLLNIL